MATPDEPHGALPPVPQGMRVDILGNIASAPILNRFHVEYTGSPPATADLHNTALLIGDSWGTNFLPLLAQDYTFLSVTCTDLSSITGAVGVETFSGVGAVTTDVSSNNVAIVLSWKAATRYRGGHPRSYISGVPAAASQGPLFWSPATANSFATSAAKFLTDVNAAGAGVGGSTSLVCIHYFRHHAFLSPPTLEPITGVTVNTKKRSQRRRLLK